MIRRLCLELFLFMLVFAASDCGELTDQTKISDIYLNNKEIFQTAVESGDYSEVEKLDGIRSISDFDRYVEFYCGGTGMGSNTNYYGILYCGGDLARIMCVPGCSVTQNGGEVLIEEDDGDNSFRYVPLGDGFWFFEMHF